MPFEAPYMATMDEHIRNNIVSNGLTDHEIAERLRRKGYKHPQRYLDRFKAGALARSKLVMAVAELIEEQDKRRSRAPS